MKRLHVFCGALIVSGTYLSSPLLGQTGPWSTGSGSTIYYNGGNVGIGTTSPAAALHVSASANPAAIRLTTTGSPKWSGIQFENTALTGGSVRWALYNGQGGVASDALSVYNYATSGDSLTIASSGNVGIGTLASQYRLSVIGTIGTKEVVVTNTGWADYVLKPGYQLRPLAEVSAYIQQHQHLPDIPSEKDVQENGVSIGDMQAKLLAKVEELTLHMIQEHERNDRLEQRNRELEERLVRLEGR